MNKQELFAELRQKLAGLPQDDIDGHIGFYAEMIADRIEEGATEEEAVAELGDTNDIAKQIASEIPLAKLVKEKVKPSRALRPVEIVLLVLGSPLWLSVLITLFALALAVYIVAWGLIVTLWAIEASIAACSVGGVFASVVFVFRGSALSGMAMLGCGILLAGISIFGGYGCKYATDAILKLTKKIFTWIKSLLIKKER